MTRRRAPASCLHWVVTAGSQYLPGGLRRGNTFERVPWAFDEWMSEFPTDTNEQIDLYKEGVDLSNQHLDDVAVSERSTLVMIGDEVPEQIADVQVYAEGAFEVSFATPASPTPDQTESTGSYEPERPANVDALTDRELQNIDRWRAGNSTDAAVEKYGAEPVFLAAVFGENWFVLDEVPELRAEVPNSNWIEGGRETCSELDARKTLDEIFMESYDAVGVTEVQDPGFFMADLIWSMILWAPKTLCPEHLEKIEEFEEDMH